MGVLFSHRLSHAVMALLIAAVASMPAYGDEWLVYIGGGLEAIEGGWEERNGLVLFTMRGGTLVSVPFQDVDLPTSVFITWQLGGRRQVPPRPALPTPAAGGGVDPEAGCTPATLLAVGGSESLEVAIEGEPETVHPACLDAPEIQHQFVELTWFGRATLSAIEISVKAGEEICLTELDPPLADRTGHRIVMVTLADGTDYAARVIAGGLGLLRPGRCPRAAYYRQLEDRAIAEQRGLWGRMSEKVAFQAATHTASVAGGAAPARRSGGG